MIYRQAEHTQTKLASSSMGYLAFHADTGVLPVHPVPVEERFAEQRWMIPLTGNGLINLHRRRSRKDN